MRKETSLYVLGLFFLALGIRLIVDSKLGAGPWDLLCIGLYERTGVSIGMWQIINNIVMIVVTKFLFQQRWNIVCLIPGIILGVFIDILGMIDPFMQVDPYVLLALGCCFSGIGLAFYMNQGLSANAIDNFVFTMNKTKSWSSGFCKILCDSIPLIFIIGLQMELQFATVIVYLFVPIFMQFFMKLFKKMNIITFA